MPILSVPLDHAGRPIVELYVGVSAAEAEFRPSCPTVPVRALVDTGASKTNIVRWVFDRLGISPVSQVLIHTASTGPTPSLAGRRLRRRDLTGWGEDGAARDRPGCRCGGGSEWLGGRGAAGSGHSGAGLVGLRRLGGALHVGDRASRSSAQLIFMETLLSGLLVVLCRSSTIRRRGGE